MSEDIIFDCLHAEIVNYCLDDNKENDFSTLEYIGFTTGFRLIERLTRDASRFKNELETIKYICTDFWTIIYKKQVDNLRTNNQGMYVVQDKAFRFLTRISPGTKQLEHAPKFVAFTCGLVRGALSNLGINSTVTAEVQSIPACKFHIEDKSCIVTSCTVDSYSFILLLQKLANSSKTDSSFTVTLKRYNGHDKPKPRIGKPALPDPEEYMCLMRAQSKSKKISTVVKHDDVPKMMTMYAQFMKSSMDGLKRVKKIKSKAKAAKG